MTLAALSDRTPAPSGRRIAAGRPAALDLPALADFLRRRHPIKTADCVAAETGVPVGTVENWLCGRAAPAGSSFAALLVAYGPAVLAAALPVVPRWVDEAARAEALARLEAEQARLAARMAELRR